MGERSSRILIAAGLVTWAVMACGWALSGGLARSPVDIALSAVCWGAFAIGFFLVARRKLRPEPTAALLALQSCCVLALTRLGHGGLSGVLFAVIAGELGMVFPPALVTGWLVLQSLVFFGLHAQQVSFGSAAFTSIGYLGFQLFAFGASRLARREAEGRAELARVNAELLATQWLLADTTRTAERLRISRELHDTMGHHLTALALQLEVAKNTAPGNEAVLRSQELARSMLTEVREVVGALREDRPLDLRRALEVLVSGLPSVRVHLSIKEGLEVLEPATAHAAFRCVQEALTNSVRHGRADNVWVSLSPGRHALGISVRDDGRGVPSVNFGHGLTGLRERLRELGGDIEVAAAPGRGLEVRAILPWVAS